MVVMGNTAEICAQIADIVHPVDDWELGKLGATVGDDVADEWIAEADRKRADYIHRLMLRCDGDTRREDMGYVEPADPDDPEDPFHLDGPDTDHHLPDPLTVALRDTADEIRILQARQRELIAYAREFAPPGYRYTLETIADAVDMSISGVRTSFHNNITSNVARTLDIGAHKRRAMQDPRWIAVRNAAKTAAE
jgi:hypothetical protein